MDGIFFMITFDGVEDHFSDHINFFRFFFGEVAVVVNGEDASSTDEAKLFFRDFDGEGFHGSFLCLCDINIVITQAEVNSQSHKAM